MAKEINLFEQEIETVYVGENCAPEGNNQKTAPRAPLQHDLFIRQHAKRIVEALLFSSNAPLSFLKIREVVETFQPIKPRVLRELIDELKEDYLSQQRAYRLEEIAEGFVLRTCAEYSHFIDLLHRNKRTEKLSPASTEVLAIIAYRQPITRAQIETIRGVDCTGVMQNLLERQLIEPTGRLETPGRPSQYGITKKFLKHFGLRSLQDLPGLDVR
jgi:segregation and condensation protein B